MDKNQGTWYLFKAQAPVCKYGFVYFTFSRCELVKKNRFGGQQWLSRVVQAEPPISMWPLNAEAFEEFGSAMRQITGYKPCASTRIMAVTASFREDALHRTTELLGLPWFCWDWMGPWLLAVHTWHQWHEASLHPQLEIRMLTQQQNNATFGRELSNVGTHASAYFRLLPCHFTFKPEVASLSHSSVWHRIWNTWVNFQAHPAPGRWCQHNSKNFGPLRWSSKSKHVQTCPNHVWP